MKIVILDGSCLNPGDLSWDTLHEIGALEIYDRTPVDQIAMRAAAAEIVLTTKAPLSAATLQQLPNLKYIGVVATGYNMIDIAAAKARGIVVTNIPTYGTSSVAQFTFALLLELCHRVGMHSEAVRHGEWSRSPDWSFWKSPQVELAGKTIGIIGFGRIGRQAASIAHALGMRVVANDSVTSDAPEYPGFAWLPVDHLLAEADVVSLHCPLTAENTGLINRRRLATMKSTALLLNTSRGPLIVEQDLADALNAGVIAGAGLDVLSVEPPPESNPLIGARNCIVTPHIAWATKEARQRLVEVAVENLRAFVAGHPENVV